MLVAATYRHSAFEGTDVFANSLRMKAMEAQAAGGNGELLKSVDALIDRWLVSRNPTRPREVDPRECVSFRSPR